MKFLLIFNEKSSKYMTFWWFFDEKWRKSRKSRENKKKHGFGTQNKSCREFYADHDPALFPGRKNIKPAWAGRAGPASGNPWPRLEGFRWALAKQLFEAPIQLPVLTSPALGWASWKSRKIFFKWLKIWSCCQPGPVAGSPRSKPWHQQRPF